MALSVDIFSMTRQIKSLVSDQVFCLHQGDHQQPHYVSHVESHFAILEELLTVPTYVLRDNLHNDKTIVPDKYKVGSTA